MNTRRQFLITAPLTVLGAAVGVRRRSAGRHRSDARGRLRARRRRSAPGRRPGRRFPPSTFAEAEKLVQVTMTPGRARDGGSELAAGRWRRCLERRAGPRKVALGADSRARHAVEPGDCRRACGRVARSSSSAAGPSACRCPPSDADIAFAPGDAAVALDRGEGAHLRASDRASICGGSSSSIRSCAASSRSRRNARSRRRRRPTLKSRPGDIAGRCTAFRMA